MAGLSQLLGIDFEAVEFEGTTYQLRELDLIGLARLSTWLEKRAWEGIERAAADMPESTVRAMRRDLIADIAAGVYAPGGDAFSKAIFAHEGQAYILYLSASANHPTVTLETCKRMLLAKAEELQAKLAEVAPDPKASSADPEGSPAGAT